MDATDTGEAVLVALSCGAAYSVHVAADHPDRVTGIFAIGPSCGFTGGHSDRDEALWDAVYDTHEGWRKYNEDYWLNGDYDDFVEFFFSKMFNEPHSTKQIEDCVGWGHEISPQTLVDTTAGRIGCNGAVCLPLEPVCSRVRCPVMVVHGTNDEIRPHDIAERLAELTGGSLVLLEGVGHGPLARQPVLINLMIRDFVDRLRPPPVERRTWVAAPRRPRRALYLSSPIGLGHARRDVAIVEELRKLEPDLEVDWLAQHPVTRVLEDAGERVHPASAWLANESAHIEHEAGEHDLHAFQAIRRMDEILVNNFMVFQEVVEQEHYDLVIGDEAWDVDYFLHENPELKRFAFAWMTDFVGWIPMPDGGDREARLTADYNAEMIEQRARFARVRDRSVFVGNLEDVVPESFGPGLPMIRDWVREEFDFAGYVTGFDPADVADRDGLRSRLGIREDEQRCVVTVGGSGVGAPMLKRVLDAVPARPSAAPRPAVPGRGRTADRPEVAAPPPRRIRPRARAGPLPAPRRVRPRGRPGRAHHHHGADGHPAALRVRAAAAPLRAELPRPAPPRAVRRGALPRLRGGRRPGRPRRGDRARGRPEGRPTSRSRPTAPRRRRGCWPTCSDAFRARSL